MPMLDAYIPDGVLPAAAEEALLVRLTDVLLKWEGADPNDAFARSIAWVFLHRPALVLIGGRPTSAPTYKIVASVPEGQLDDEQRAGMVAEVTEAVLDAEEGRHARDPLRVWVFTHEIPEGSWGGGGKIYRLADIAAFVLGDRAAGEAHARRALATSRKARQALSA